MQGQKLCNTGNACAKLHLMFPLEQRDDSRRGWMFRSEH
jgi:hypothetical protein